MFIFVPVLLQYSVKTVCMALLSLLQILDVDLLHDILKYYLLDYEIWLVRCNDVFCKTARFSNIDFENNCDCWSAMGQKI